MDERTEKLLDLVSTNGALDSNKLFDFNLQEFDTYRLFLYSLSQVENQMAKQERMPYLNKFKNNVFKTFTIKPDILHLLLLTVSCKSARNLKLPFNNIFIDASFILEDNLKIMGMTFELLTKGEQKQLREAISLRKFNSLNKSNYSSEFYHTLGKKDLLTAYVHYLDINRKKMAFTNFFIDLEKGEIAEYNQAESQKYQRRIKDFIINLLLFFNEPRVTMYIIDKKKPARRKTGTIPIPSQLRTKLHYELKNYIEKIYITGQSHSKLGYSYWVRGHWRRFISPKFKNKQGQKTWILPHIRGEGLMPPQVFEVTK